MKSTRPRGSKPRSTPPRLCSVRRNNPAPATSGNDTAICSASSARPIISFGAPGPVRSSASASVLRLNRIAGSRPARTPAAHASAAVAPSERPVERDADAARAEAGREHRLQNRRDPQRDTRPAAPPIALRMTLSSSSSRMMRARPAPSARRTASSLCRETPRASIRPATLRHAMKQHDAGDRRQDAKRKPRARAQPVESARAGKDGDGRHRGDLRLDAAVDEHAGSVGLKTRPGRRLRVAGHARDQANPVRLRRAEERRARPDHSGEISGCFASAMVTSVGGRKPPCDSPR